MDDRYWRAAEMPEEDVVCPDAPLMHRADARLEGRPLRRLRAQAEINWRRYVPVHR